MVVEATRREQDQIYSDSRVSLLIKSCYMEWESIEAQVKHLLTHLESPVGFYERILAVDCRTSDFTRAYGVSNPSVFQQVVERLISEDWIDQVVWCKPDSEVFYRWFGLKSLSSHSVQGAPLLPFLQGVEACSGDYVLQLDSDLLIGRIDPEHDWLADMIHTLRSDSKALTASLPIYKPGAKPPENMDTSFWFTDNSCRIEVRGALFDRKRLLASRPWPNTLAGNDRVALAWHRSLDNVVRQGDWSSWRGGYGELFFIHPTNEYKKDLASLQTIRNQIEAGFCPKTQAGHVDLQGDIACWLGPRRREPFIFLVCGRNVEPSRFQRCLDSMLRQKVVAEHEWGAVVMDDDSSRRCRDYIKWALSPYKNKVTFIAVAERRSLLANMVWAARYICDNTESVLITLDADDCLIGSRVIETVAEAYNNGADLTVGSMIRTDKVCDYPVDFSCPREGNNRGGKCLATFTLIS